MAQPGTAQVSKQQSGVSKVRACQIGATEAGYEKGMSQVGTPEDRTVQLRPADPGSLQVGPAEIRS